jgi:hypothetical protein
MTVTIRFYLFADDGLYRISHRLVTSLIHGTDAMPQYAGTKQKTADVYLEIDDGKPIKILRAEGSFLTFDEKGQVHRGLMTSGFAALETAGALKDLSGKPPDKVVDLAPKLNRDKWQRENRWTLTTQDLDAIADDIWKRKRVAAPKVQQAKGSEPVKPKITWEAKQALEEIQKKIVPIKMQLDLLTEQSLKGVVFETKRRSKEDFDDALWLGVAQAADRKREILARYRSGSGTWIGYIEVMRWDETRRSCESIQIIHQKCSSKQEAVEAARRLLSENVHWFTAETSVDARIACDLEWEDDEEG